MIGIAVVTVLELAAGTAFAQPAIITAYTPAQLVAFNQAPNFICPVDASETPVPLSEAGIPKTVELSCMAGVEVPVAGSPARAHDLLGGKLTLRLVSETPLRYEDEFHGRWLAALEGSSIVLRPTNPRGYAFEVKDGALVLRQLVEKGELSKILAGSKTRTRLSGDFAIHEDLPANVRTSGETLQKQ